MIDLSKHIQEGARLELEALERSTDECSFLSAQNSYQEMKIDELKRELAAAQEARQAAEERVRELERIDLKASRLYRALNGLDIDDHDKRAERVMVQWFDGTNVSPGNRNSLKSVLAEQFAVVAQAAEALAESYRKDAERYRWLRMNRLWLKANLPMIAAAEFDAAIDAAIAEGKN